MLAGGTVVGVAAQNSASADVSSGDRPVLIQISPCRLADSRTNQQVGPQAGKIGATETVSFDVQNSTTECAGSIPTDAVGISTNITALGATNLSFLTIWPSGPRPLAASLNPAPGEPPTPNAVTTSIDGGSFNIYNNAGATHVVIDVNGYYVNHNHDDLYGGDTGPSTAGTFSVGSAAFQPWHTNIQMETAIGNGNGEGGAWITSAGPAASGTTSVQPSLVAPIQLPHGAKITDVTAYFTDSYPTGSLNFQLRTECFNDFVTFVANGDSASAPSSGVEQLDVVGSATATVDNEKCTYFVVAEAGSWATAGDDMKIHGFSVTTE